jgi:hypothetical protein
LEVDHAVSEGEPPKPMPIPALGVLANIRAQEKEGVDLLLKDPTKFFVFDNGSIVTTSETATENEYSDSLSSSETYQGPTLGTPIRLKDPLRDYNGGRVFPIAIGKMPKPDTRTEKEKKRQEREERLWAATQQTQKGTEEENLELLIPEEDREYGEAIDYNNNDDWDSDDEEWEKGLDKETDSDIWNVPREFRYREQDIDFVIAKLEQKAKIMQSHVHNTIQTMEQEARSRMDRAMQQRNATAAAAKQQQQQVPNNDSAGSAEDSTDSEEAFFDAKTTERLYQVGADVKKYEQLMSSFTQEQLLALFGLDAQKRTNDDIVSMEDTSPHSSIFEGIPNITPEQVIGLTELESFMKVLEKSPSSLSPETEA